MAAKKILVADDDQNQQILLFHTLRMEGFEVVQARDGHDALRLAHEVKPDLIILDVMMPGISGIDVCRLLRGEPDTAALPIIMLSGLNTVPEKVLGLQAGADDYVTKPIDLRELSVRVHAQIRRYTAIRQASSARSGRIWTVLGAKGGTGATTVALNLAAALAQTGKAVAAVELRGDYGTFASQLRTNPERNLSAMLRMEPAAITEPLVASLLYRTSFDVQLLFGPQHADEMGSLDPATAAAVLGRLIPQADYIIVDLPAVTLPATEAVVKNSGLILIAVEPEITSVAAAGARLRQLEAWGISRSMVGVLVVNRQGNMLLSLREMENRLDRPITAVVPPAMEALGVAVQYGTPLVIYQPTHMASQNLIDLAARLVEKPLALART